MRRRRRRACRPWRLKHARGGARACRIAAGVRHSSTGEVIARRARSRSLASSASLIQAPARAIARVAAASRPASRADPWPRTGTTSTAIGPSARSAEPSAASGSRSTPTEAGPPTARGGRCPIRDRPGSEPFPAPAGGRSGRRGAGGGGRRAAGGSRDGLRRADQAKAGGERDRRAGRSTTCGSRGSRRRCRPRARRRWGSRPASGGARWRGGSGGCRARARGLHASRAIPAGPGSGDAGGRRRPRPYASGPALTSGSRRPPRRGSCAVRGGR